MQRVFWLTLLLATACVRRETVSGSWTGAAGPDASAPGSGPISDQSPEKTAGPIADAAPGKSATAAEVAPPFAPPDFPPPDASAGGSAPPDARAATAEGPALGPRDASPDTTDAHPCPDADRCD